MRLFFALVFSALLFLPLPVFGSQMLPGFSQVKVRGDAAGDEFIELFNPSDAPLDLNGYTLVKETSSGRAYTLLTFGSLHILPRSFMLLALEDGAFATQADLTYKTALADDNRLLLLDQAQTEADALAWGDAAGLPNHAPEQSFQRSWQESTSQWTPWVSAPFEHARTSGDVWIQQPAPENEEPVIAPEEPEPEPEPEATAPMVRLHEAQLNAQNGDMPWIELEIEAGAATALSGWKVLVDGELFAALNATAQNVNYLVVFANTTFSSSSHEIQLLREDAVLDTVPVPANALAAVSYARTPTGWGWTAVPTGGRPNVISEPLAPVCPSPASHPTPPPANSSSGMQPVATSGRIRLNEVFANPSGDEAAGEFIELFNEESYPVSLQNWSIADLAKSTVLKDLRIEGGAYLILRRADSGLSLNNGAETITLFDGAKNTVSAFQYQAAFEDRSWNMAVDGWYEASPTPGALNEPPAQPALAPADHTPETEPSHIENAESELPVAPQETAEFVVQTTRQLAAPAQTSATSVAANPKKGRQVTFAEWTKVKANEQITMLGILTVAPGVFGEKVATLQDFKPGLPGIELYFSKADWPDLEEGDVLSVTGKKSQAKQGDRLLLAAGDDIEILDHTFPEAEPLSIGALSARRHRTLITMDARLIEQKKDVWIIADETHELTASSKKAGFASDVMEGLPRPATVTGLYIHAKTPELWLRSEDDIFVEDAPATADEPAETPSAQTDATAMPNMAIEASSNPESTPWLPPLAAASSAGGLTWYFFQDPLRQQAMRVWRRLQEMKN